MSKIRFSEIVLEKNKKTDIQVTHYILNMWEPLWEQHGSEISPQYRNNGYRITPNILPCFSIHSVYFRTISSHTTSYMVRTWLSHLKPIWEPIWEWP